MRFPARANAYAAGFAGHEIGVAGFACTAAKRLGQADSCCHGYVACRSDVALSQLWVSFVASMRLLEEDLYAFSGDLFHGGIHA
jgi:hypothetical protein